MKEKNVVKKEVSKKRMLFKKQMIIILGLLFGSVLCGWLGWLVSKSFDGTMWAFVDTFFTRFVISIRSPFFTTIMKIFTSIGMYGTILGWTIVLGLLLYYKKWPLVIMSLFLVVGGWGFSYGLKQIIGRERPVGYALVSEFSHSFPSSHAFTSIILYITLSYFMYHFSRHFWRSIGIFTLSLWFVLLIGISRIYLGVHYASDVFGGYVIGLSYFLLTLSGFRLYCLICRKHC